MQNLYSFDHNLCVFCTSCVPKLVILETKNGHIGVHVTKNGRFVYQKWYTIVSCVPKLVILETKNGFRDERSEARWPWNVSGAGIIGCRNRVKKRLKSPLSVSWVMWSSISCSSQSGYAHWWRHFAEIFWKFLSRCWECFATRSCEKGFRNIGALWRDIGNVFALLFSIKSRGDLGQRFWLPNHSLGWLSNLWCNRHCRHCRGSLPRRLVPNMSSY